MVMCALPPALLAILVTLTPPPHDPAKRNTADDKNPSAVKHMLSVCERYSAILAAHSCALLSRVQEPTPRQTRAQEPDATKPNALNIRENGGRRADGDVFCGAATAAGWLPAPWTATP